MSLDPNKTYLTWYGNDFPDSTKARFKAPAGSTIDWGDGKVQTFDTADTNITTHTYLDGKTEHTIVISGIMTIVTRAFSGCSSLTSVIIGNSVTSIGYAAFRGCTSLTSVTIPDSVTRMDDSVFYGCSSLTSATIGNGAKSLGFGLFENCSSLTSVTFKNGVTSISSWLFKGCSSLTSVTIPDSVTSIGDYVFEKCSSLTNITIPDSVTSIGNYAFLNCTNLKTIVLFPETPPTLGSTNAIPTTIQSIYVQQSSKEAYKTATNWTSFADKLVSNNLYLSFVQFNIKNKEYIEEKVNILKEYVDESINKSIITVLNTEV